MARLLRSESDKLTLIPRIDEIEIFGEEVYLILYKDDRKVTLQLEKEISLEQAVPLLNRFFGDLGKTQANERLITEGHSIPWSRSLEGGESAFVLDQKYLGKTHFSKLLWENFTNTLPHPITVDSNKSTSCWKLHNHKK